MISLNIKMENTDAKDVTNSTDKMKYTETEVDDDDGLDWSAVENKAEPTVPTVSDDTIDMISFESIMKNKPKVLNALIVAFIICVIIIVIYSVILQNNYNELVMRLNDCLASNPSKFLI
jgi:hypothetical protein